MSRYLPDVKITFGQLEGLPTSAQGYGILRGQQLDEVASVVSQEDQSVPPWSMLGIGDPDGIGGGHPWPVDLVTNPTDDTCDLMLGMSISGTRMELMTVWPTYPAADRFKVYATGTHASIGTRPLFRYLVNGDIPEIDAGKLGFGVINTQRLPVPFNNFEVPPNQVLAGPSNPLALDDAPVYRALVANDIPSLPTAKIAGVFGYAQTTFPPDYISGFRLSRGGANTLVVTSGTAYIQSLGRPVDYAGGTTSVPTGTNTWYHVYTTGAGLIVTATVPAAPYFGTARSQTGFTSRRYIGSVRTDASGNLRFWKHDWQTGMVLWLENITAAPFRVLAGGTATTRTNVDCSAVAPVTSTEVRVLALIITNNSAFCTFDNGDRTLPVDQGFAYVNAAGMNSMQTMLDIATNTVQIFRYSWIFAMTGAGAFLDVMGYRYER